MEWGWFFDLPRFFLLCNRWSVVEMRANMRLLDLIEVLGHCLTLYFLAFCLRLTTCLVTNVLYRRELMTNYRRCSRSFVLSGITIV